jgi:PAS domain S-box-containing protein
VIFVATAAAAITHPNRLCVPSQKSCHRLRLYTHFERHNCYDWGSGLQAVRGTSDVLGRYIDRLRTRVNEAAIPAAEQFRAFEPPGHACIVSEHDSEHLALIARFTRIGLERAEQCVCLHAAGDQARLLHAFQQEGINVEAARNSNALVLISPGEANLKGDSFDPYRLLAVWKKLASRARPAGFSAMRCAIAMSTFALGPASAERWLEYEAQLTGLAEDHRCLFLCHYARRAFGPEELLGFVCSHSSIIHAGEIAPNLYYRDPSRDASVLDPYGLALDCMLAAIANRAGIERTRGEPGKERLTSNRLEVALASSAVPFMTLAAVRNSLGIIRDFTWQYVNPAAARVIGRNADELLGRAATEVLPHGQNSLGLVDCFVRVVETGQPGTYETNFTAGGTLRWWQNLISKLDEGVAVWFSEITERKHAEEQYRRSQAYLADGERLSHTGSWAWDIASQEISFWSLGHCRILGIDPKTRPTYAQLRGLVHPDELPFIEETFARAVRERAGFDYEFRILRADGVRYVRSVGRPVFDEHGALVEYAGTLIDVTEQREAEAALRASQAALARVARLTTAGELSTSIAHEVNQPLGAIILHGDAARRWLARKPPEANEALNAIEGMMANAHRARDVIARIRALASKAGQPHETLDVNELVKGVLEIARGELSHADILVRTELRASWAQGDRVQLQQVLLNLIMNAIDAMTMREQGPRELLIRTSDDSEESVHIEVRDSGIGVSEDSLARMFEPFYTTKAQGTGIGLSISRSIIEAHNGRLWAKRNETAPGLTLHIALPRALSAPRPDTR